MYSQRGFTIIELMIALLVLSILISLGIPSFASFMSNNRLTSQANSFHSAILFARSEAVKRNEQVQICWSGNTSATNPCGANGTGWSDGWLIFVDDDADGQRDATETILRTQDGLDGGSTVTSAADEIVYLSDGRAAVGNLTLKFCDANNNDAYTRELNINSLGSPRVSKQGTCP